MSDLENYGQVVEVDGTEWRLLDMVKSDLEGNWLCLAVKKGDSHPQPVYSVIVPGDKV